MKHPSDQAITFGGYSLSFDEILSSEGHMILIILWGPEHGAYCASNGKKCRFLNNVSLSAYYLRSIVGIHK